LVLAWKTVESLLQRLLTGLLALLFRKETQDQGWSVTNDDRSAAIRKND